MLTAVYALMQVVFAPIWGRWSDAMGRRPLLLLGIVGYAVAQVLFGVATSLWLLYLARLLGGILSSATAPVAAAYVADLTTDAERARGMAWLGAATNMGVVVGPAFAGVLTRQDLHWSAQFGHLKVDSFSIPFFAAATLALVALPAAMRWVPESRLRPRDHVPSSGDTGQWQQVVRPLGRLLGVAIAVQFGLTVFETTFALHAKEMLGYGPGRVGAAFIVCGAVMTLFQLGVVDRIGSTARERAKITAGVALVGVSLAVMPVPRGTVPVLMVIGLLAFGVALVGPNLTSLISRRAGGHTGAALGAQHAANGLGQAAGALFGSLLFSWRMAAPYVLTGTLLATAAIVMVWRDTRRHARRSSAAGVRAIPPDTRS